MKPTEECAPGRTVGVQSRAVSDPGPGTASFHICVPSSSSAQCLRLPRNPSADVGVRSRTCGSFVSRVFCNYHYLLEKCVIEKKIMQFLP